MKIKYLLPFLFMSAVLVGCGQANSNENTSLKEKEVENVRELVGEYSSNKTKNESASITSEELIVKKSNNEEIIYDISDEDFFVSIAPYVNETHP